MGCEEYHFIMLQFAMRVSHLAPSIFLSWRAQLLAPYLGLLHFTPVNTMVGSPVHCICVLFLFPCSWSQLFSWYLAGHSNGFCVCHNALCCVSQVPTHKYSHESLFVLSCWFMYWFRPCSARLICHDCLHDSGHLSGAVSRAISPGVLHEAVLHSAWMRDEKHCDAIR